MAKSLNLTSELNGLSCYCIGQFCIAKAVGSFNAVSWMVLLLLGGLRSIDLCIRSRCSVVYIYRCSISRSPEALLFHRLIRRTHFVSDLSSRVIVYFSKTQAELSIVISPELTPLYSGKFVLFSRFSFNFFLLSHFLDPHVQSVRTISNLTNRTIRHSNIVH